MLSKFRKVPKRDPFVLSFPLIPIIPHVKEKSQSLFSSMFPIYIHKKVLYEDWQHLKDFSNNGETLGKSLRSSQSKLPMMLKMITMVCNHQCSQYSLDVTIMHSDDGPP
jgi:hypothetical protein